MTHPRTQPAPQPCRWSPRFCVFFAQQERLRPHAQLPRTGGSAPTLQPTGGPRRPPPHTQSHTRTHTVTDEQTIATPPNGLTKNDYTKRHALSGYPKRRGNLNIQTQQQQRSHTQVKATPTPHKTTHTQAIATAARHRPRGSRLAEWHNSHGIGNGGDRCECRVEKGAGLANNPSPPRFPQPPMIHAPNTVHPTLAL